MEKTPFAGLTRLAPGEPLASDDYSFQDQNPVITDKLLRLAAQTHKHDGHAALIPTDPEIPPVVTVSDTGGLIPAATDLSVVYTLLDVDGGETIAAAEPVTQTTQSGIEAPDNAPTLAVETTDGTLLVGNYVYGVSVTDGTGGETGIGTLAEISITPLSDTNQIRISGLTAIMTDASGTGWRLWRMVDGNPWGLLDTGTGDEVVDDGSFCLDPTLSPPQGTNTTTNATNRLRVTVPASGQPAGAVTFRIYCTTTGSFGSLSLLGEYPVADFGVEKVYTTLPTLEGFPPESSLALAGASKINALTDIINISWLPPVATAADLPSSGNSEGDVRVTLDDGLFHMYISGAWVAAGGGGGGGEMSVGTHLTWRFTDLTTAEIFVEETVVDTYMIADDFTVDTIDADHWTILAGAGEISVDTGADVLKATAHTGGAGRVLSHDALLPLADFTVGMKCTPASGWLTDTVAMMGIAFGSTATAAPIFLIGGDLLGSGVNGNRVQIYGGEVYVDVAAPAVITGGADTFWLMIHRVAHDLIFEVYDAAPYTTTNISGDVIVSAPTGAVPVWTHTLVTDDFVTLSQMVPGADDSVRLNLYSIELTTEHQVFDDVIAHGNVDTVKELHMSVGGHDHLLLDKDNRSDFLPEPRHTIGDPLVGGFAGGVGDWVDATDRRKVSYWKDGDTVHFEGAVSHGGAGPVADEDIFFMPSGYYPVADTIIEFPTVSGDTSTPAAPSGVVRITPLGNVQWVAGETGTDNFISFEGLSYRV